MSDTDTMGRKSKQVGRLPRLNLYSDTQTMPTKEMLTAMAEAELGDEHSRSDPTVNALQDHLAELTGKEAGLFLPTGTMANLIAVLVHCGRRGAVLCHQSAHLYRLEAGAVASLGGAVAIPLSGDRGVFTVDALDAVWTNRDLYPPLAMVSMEQTTNLPGGCIWSPADMKAVSDWSRAKGLSVHTDGARLFNAVAGSHVPTAEYTQQTDSLWVDLSKGLGCPMGAVLLGSRAFVEEAFHWKFALGGAMRQAGVMAAAGLYALKHHRPLLEQDHVRARALAQGLEGLAAYGCRVLNPMPETNMVFLALASSMDARSMQRRLMDDDLRVSTSDFDGRTVLRFVTHFQITDADIRETVAVMERCVKESRET